MWSTVDAVENVNDVKAPFPGSFSQILKTLLIWQITQVWSALISLQHTLAEQSSNVEKWYPECISSLVARCAVPLAALALTSHFSPSLAHWSLEVTSHHQTFINFNFALACHQGPPLLYGQHENLSSFSFCLKIFFSQGALLADYSYHQVQQGWLLSILLEYLIKKYK